MLPTDDLPTARTAMNRWSDLYDRFRRERLSSGSAYVSDNPSGEEFLGRYGKDDGQRAVQLATEGLDLRKYLIEVCGIDPKTIDWMGMYIDQLLEPLMQEGKIGDTRLGGYSIGGRYWGRRLPLVSRDRYVDVMDVPPVNGGRKKEGPHYVYREGKYERARRLTNGVVCGDIPLGKVTTALDRIFEIIGPGNENEDALLDYYQIRMAEERSKMASANDNPVNLN